MEQGTNLNFLTSKKICKNTISFLDAAERYYKEKIDAYGEGNVP